MKKLAATCFLISLLYNKGLTQSEPSWVFSATGMIEKHSFEVTNGPPPTRGVYDEQNFAWGIAAHYNTRLHKKLNGYLGLGYLQYTSSIFRAYERRFWGDLRKILTYTNNTRYHLLSLPVGVDWTLIDGSKFSVLLGTSMNMNFSFLQGYGMKGLDRDHKIRFYFFGYSNQVSLAFQQKLPKGRFLELRPFVTLFERWRKDEILNENKDEYHQLNLNAFGLKLAYGIPFR